MGVSGLFNDLNNPSSSSGHPSDRCNLLTWCRMMKEARGGGSVNPEYKKLLMKLEKEGKVEIKEHTRVIGAERDDQRKMWKLALNTGGEPLVDCVVYATGIAADLNNVKALKRLMEQAPLEMVGGMPCLTNDLMWNDEIPLFFTGRLAGLRLGPAAGNLEGARQGAERIAWKVGELVGGGDEGDSGYGSELSGEDEVDRYVETISCFCHGCLKAEALGAGLNAPLLAHFSKSIANTPFRRRLGLGFENQFGVLGLSDDE